MVAHDPRIPVRFGPLADAGEGDALLVEEGVGTVPDRAPAARFAPAGPFAHAPGCPCCGARNPVSLALQGLFVARARGEAASFRSVLAVVSSEAGAKLVRSALSDDGLAAARFRLEK